jgi:hypothetical protein
MKKSTNSGPVPGMARKSNIFDIFSVLDLNPNKKKKNTLFERAEEDVYNEKVCSVST